MSFDGHPEEQNNASGERQGKALPKGKIQVSDESGWATTDSRELKAGPPGHGFGGRRFPGETLLSKGAASKDDKEINENSLKRKLKTMCARPKRLIVEFYDDETDKSLHAMIR